MCGIAGIINFNNRQVSNDSIQCMMKAMKYRGPDDEGLLVDSNVGLGFVRLSILDLSSRGHQPMFSNNGRYSIVFNGEIYNYIELKTKLKEYNFKSKTDTEVILAAYEKWGEDFLDYLNGMFAICIYDKQKKKIFIARDRFGIKPLYYYQDKERFVFASDIPAILAVVKNAKVADYQSIYDFLLFNRTNYSDRTFFEKIKKLRPAHKISIQNNLSKINKWYNLKNTLSSPFKNNEEFTALLTDSINLRLRSDVPVGVCLSGGIDSSAITSLILNRLGKSDIHSFSSVFGAGQTGDESQYINLYKNKIKNMHFIHPTGDSLLDDLDDFIKAIVEPIPSTSEYSEYKVMQLAKENCTVLLSGQGADEEMAGYKYFFGYYFKELLLNMKLKSLIKGIYYYNKNNDNHEGIKAFAFSLLPKKMKDSKILLSNNYISSDFFNSYNLSSEITNLYDAKTLKQFLLNHFNHKLEHHLSWSDRSGMWFSLETRFPFLDHRFVQKILSHKSKDIIFKGINKSILRKSLTGIMPQEIIDRKDKVGFETPEDTWFRTSKFKDLIMDIIKSDKFKSRGIFDIKYVLNRYNQHISGKINIGKEIWKWIHLELWFREYID